MVASTVEELIAGFTHSSLPKVTGEPMFKDIKRTRRALNTNAMGVQSYAGGGRHGHLSVVQSDAEYIAIAGRTFVQPLPPNEKANVPENATAAQITEAHRAHAEETRVYRVYHNCDQACKKLIIEAYDEQYLSALSDDIVEYANRTAYELIQHLVTNYAIIAPTELIKNYERISQPYDPNTPIETLFTQIREGAAYAAAGGQPYSDEMLVNIAYTLVFNTGIFADGCRKWSDKGTTDKTWANFMVDFSMHHRSQRLITQTAGQSGFGHNANMVNEDDYVDIQGTAEALAMLASATAADRGTVATLTATNAKLTSQLEAAQAYIDKLKLEGKKPKTNKIGTGRRQPRATANENYCWSHGYQVAEGHTSATCETKKHGHKDEATKSNNMGGVQWGKV